MKPLAAALVAGVALGWVFARKRFPGDTVLEAVFMLPLGTVDPILNGAEHFAKERAGAN